MNPDIEEPYAGHVEKLQALQSKRVKPFDQSKLGEIAEVSQLFDLLGGEMELPDELEAELWMNIVGFVMKEGGAGLKINGVEWSVLDMLLAVATKTDEFPVLLLAELMMGFNHVVVVLRGRPVHAGQLYNASYDGWSKMEDLKERARHHFKFGFLLITIDELPRAVEQLQLALQCDPTSAAKDLLARLEADKGPLRAESHPTETVSPDLKTDASKPERKKFVPRDDETSIAIPVAIAVVVVASLATALWLKLRRQQ